MNDPKGKRAARRVIASFVALAVVAGIAGALVNRERHELSKVVHAVLDLPSILGVGAGPSARPVVEWREIAHAGGAVGGITYTNSREALNYNYAKGYRAFEMDMALTSDGAIVMLHDWSGNWRALRPDSRGLGIRSLYEFMTEPMAGGLHPMDWEMVRHWLREHPDAFLVTDAKADEIRILDSIAQDRDLLARIVPQIYGVGEYERVAAMGFPRIFLTLYRRDYPDWAIKRIFASRPIAALVCPTERASRGGLPAALRAMGVPVYVHTVNDASEASKFRAAGVFGVYSDYLSPGD